MATAAYPKWMLDCKTQITKSEEWATVTQDLHSAIQQELTESHVAQFTDLSEAEKRLLMQRATNAIQQGDTYKSFNLQVSSSLDTHLNAHVTHQLLEEYPAESKTDLILNQAREGAFGLLRRWPDMKSKLHLCFNQSLPDRLRQMAWKLYLRNPKARSTYLEVVKADPRSAMSILDLEIIQKCEMLLQGEPTFSDLSHNADILHAMKAVLSYHHIRKNTQNSLLDTDYMLIVPLLVNLLTTIRPDQMISDSCVALLVEEYITFMDNRPMYMKESFNPEFKVSMEVFVSSVADLLTIQVGKLSRHMQQAFSAANNLEGDLALHEGLRQLIRPMVRCMFVGYLSLDTVLYIWDQHIIGLDSVGYDIIPIMTVIILKLFSKNLLECTTLYEMEEVLKRESTTLRKEQFIYEINRHFYEDMFTALTKDHGRLPVLDPTQIAMPWTEWHKDVIPPALKAKDRQQVRDDKLQQKQKELEDQQREEEEREQQILEDKNQREREQNERQELERLLEEERQDRQRADEETRLELEALRSELENLKSGHGAEPGSPANSRTGSAQQPLTPPRSAAGESAGGTEAGSKPEEPTNGEEPPKPAEEEPGDTGNQNEGDQDKTESGQEQEASPSHI